MWESSLPNVNYVRYIRTNCNQLKLYNSVSVVKQLIEWGYRHRHTHTAHTAHRLLRSYRGDIKAFKYKGDIEWKSVKIQGDRMMEHFPDSWVNIKSAWGFHRPTHNRDAQWECYISFFVFVLLISHRKVLLLLYWSLPSTVPTENVFQLFQIPFKLVFYWFIISELVFTEVTLCRIFDVTFRRYSGIFVSGKTFFFCNTVLVVLIVLWIGISLQLYNRRHLHFSCASKQH